MGSDANETKQSPHPCSPPLAVDVEMSDTNETKQGPHPCSPPLAVDIDMLETNETKPNPRNVNPFAPKWNVVDAIWNSVSTPKKAGEIVPRAFTRYGLEKALDKAHLKEG